MLAPTVTRLPELQDPLFQRLNSSISFDIRLWPQDLRASKAHARALRDAGVLADDELAALERGLDGVGAELETGTFEVSDRDEDIHMAIERRLTEIAGAVGGRL